MGFIAELFVDIFYEVICYVVGRVVIPVISLGTARAERLNELKYSNAKVYTRRDGKIVFTDPAASLFGLLFLAALGIAAYLISER